MMSMKQKIFVLYTGGTIGMTQSSEGLRPDTALSAKPFPPFQTTSTSSGTSAIR